MPSSTVAALYVDPRGPYARMRGVDPWDAQRDARRYAGPWPVVAHPPCGQWSPMRHLSASSDRDCAPIAVEHVRRYGGVLEHPAGSDLWRACRLPLPEGLPDEHGFTIEVEQVSWGHVARKPTWLYLVGVSRELVAATRRSGGTPTHWVSGGRTPSARKLGHDLPPGMRACSPTQRRRSPPAFARWLVELAASSSTSN